MGERWHIEVDHGVCIGSGMCVNSAPEDFRLGSARQSHPVAGERDPSEAILTAAESCPVEAIIITRSGSGEAVFPPEG
ncbi:ferredoxin [Streptomyces gobiensis]|uniref:ferredoxin n=1 Tax=Streptomyces gobiensis TaxID=2875706 RepID=UPI001E5145AA|nr:ferredoxin [Streptomyces gobiensis]UGY91136.1 ferredoxin [Streptomyces gobiensis]